MEEALGVKLKYLIPPEEDPKIPNFGEKIRKVRLARGLTRQELANILGCHVNTVLRWELKGRYPQEIDRIEKCLGVKFSQK